MAVIRTAESHTGTTGSVSQTSFTFAVGQAGDAPKGILVFVFQGVSNTEAITSVTYGGQTVPAVTGGRAEDTTTEPGACKAFLLGASVPSGVQSVVVNRTSNTTTMYAVAYLLSGSGDLRVAVTPYILSNNAAMAQQSIAAGAGTTQIFAGAYSGGVTVPTAANMTIGTGTYLLYSAYAFFSAYETTPTTGTRTRGLTCATDDLAYVIVTVGDARTAVSQTLTPTYDVRQVVAQTLGGAGGGGITEVGSHYSNGLYADISNTHGLSIAAGDVVLAFVTMNTAAATCIDNNGSYPFSEQLDEDVVIPAGAGSSFAIYSRLAGASEPAAYAFTGSAANGWACLIRVFRGVDASVWDVSPSAATMAASLQSATQTSTDITTLTDGAVSIMFMAGDNDGSFGASGPTNGYGNLIQATAGHQNASCWRTVASHGAVGTMSVTIGGAWWARVVLGALKPSGSGGVTYDIRALAAQTLTPVYDIQSSLTAVAQTLSPTYNVRNLAAQTLTPAYGVLNLVAKTLTPTYDIQWLQVAQTLTPTYGVRNLAAQTLTSTYLIRNLAAQTLSPAYSIIQFVSQTLTPTYNIEAIGLTAVPQTLTPVYSLRQFTSQTLAPAYDVRTGVAQTFSPNYNIRQFTAQTLTPTYDIQWLQVAQTLTPTYAVRNLAVQTLTSTYLIRELAAGSLNPTYDVRQLVAATITPTYNVSQFIGAILTPTYDILSAFTAVVQTLMLTYNIRSLPSVLDQAAAHGLASTGRARGVASTDRARGIAAETAARGIAANDANQRGLTSAGRRREGR